MTTSSVCVAGTGLQTCTITINANVDCDDDADVYLYAKDLKDNEGTVAKIDWDAAFQTGTISPSSSRRLGSKSEASVEGVAIEVEVAESASGGSVMFAMSVEEEEERQKLRRFEKTQTDELVMHQLEHQHEHEQHRMRVEQASEVRHEQQHQSRTFTKRKDSSQVRLAPRDYVPVRNVPSLYTDMNIEVVDESREQGQGQKHMHGGRRLSSPVCDAGDLSYVLYYGLGLAVGMDELVLGGDGDGSGLVLLNTLRSPVFTLVEPTDFPVTASFPYGSGCLKFPSVAPSLFITSPKSAGQKWGLPVEHTLSWTHWSINDGETATIRFYESGTDTLVKTVTGVLVEDGSIPVISGDLFPGTAIGTSLYATMHLDSDTSVDTISPAFEIVVLAEDASAATSWSFTDVAPDEQAPFAGNLLAGDLSIDIKDGSLCEAKYDAFPMVLQCTVTFGFTVGGTEIYSFSLNAGAKVNSTDDLNSGGAGISLGYGANFPELMFPDMASNVPGSSYFLASLKDTVIVPAVSFPYGSADLLQYNTGTPNMTICLLDLLDMLQDCDECGDELTASAESISNLADMVGADVCLDLIIVDISFVSGPSVKFKLEARVDLFDAGAVDWESVMELVGEYTSPTMQAFLSASGAFGEDMASSMFDSLLEGLGLDGPITVNRNIAADLNALFTSDRRRLSSDDLSFVDSDGNFVLGTTETIVASAAPTAVPTAAPTAAPTATPTAAPTATPTAAPTATPTAAPTAIPTATPTLVNEIAVPTHQPTGEPTKVPSVTSEPTTLPSSNTPTSSPTFAPTSMPTSVPTMALKENIAINGNTLFDDYSCTHVTNDVETAFIAATKASLSNDPDLVAAMVITIEACMDSSPSSEMGRAAGAGVEPVSAEFVWTAEISDVQSMGYAEAAPLFDDMAASLTAAVDDGSFLTDFQTEVDGGSGSAEVMAITGTEMPAALTYAVDVVHSAAPSSAPIQPPDDEETDDFTVAISVGAAVGMVVVAGLIANYYMGLRTGAEDSKANKNPMATVHDQGDEDGVPVVTTNPVYNYSKDRAYLEQQREQSKMDDFSYDDL
jgi:hypothetical protein